MMIFFFYIANQKFARHEMAFHHFPSANSLIRVVGLNRSMACLFRLLCLSQLYLVVPTVTPSFLSKQCKNHLSQSPAEKLGDRSR